ncbi:CBS domain-containing protein [Maribacter sp. 2304DJ31-5]|uniref:CBS domain-containing protein n=1 Tax=Maribacter sp. 2304DJ31-5 TaxID=3386273 RepID=UPI0039BD4D29
MKKRIPISRIMTKNVVTLHTKDDLATAEEIFKKKRIRHLPITSGERIIGMLSHTDLMRISFADTTDVSEQQIDTTVYNMFTIAQIMAKNVITVSPKDTIQEVATFLTKKEFHALPVVDNNKLVGIVTTTDLINYFLDQY